MQTAQKKKNGQLAHKLSRYRVPNAHHILSLTHVRALSLTRFYGYHAHGQDGVAGAAAATAWIFE